MSGGALEGFRLLIESDKLTGYLLNTGHPRGEPKARFFIEHGFLPVDPNALAIALVRQAHSGALVQQVETEWGAQLCIQGPIDCPAGRCPNIITVWLVIPDASKVAQLATAFPA